MAEITEILKKLIPPIFLDLVRLGISKKAQSHDLVWEGPFSTWEEAAKRCTGFDQAEILDRCKSSLLKVKNGEAVYERDSVIFDEIQYSWPVLASLQKAALEAQGKLSVLDFGGSLGSSYFQNKSFLSSVDLTWCIVEQEHFVACGKEFFEDQSLKFYTNVDSCLAENNINAVLLSSVLQYIPSPYDIIDKIISLKIPYIIIDRTAVTSLNEDFIAIQRVPEEIYSASYPCYFFSKERLLSSIRGYSNITGFNSGFTTPYLINQTEANWLGFLLKRDE
jgi:putative methyltransferase (TIGR04325 family)